MIKPRPDFFQQTTKEAQIKRLEWLRKTFNLPGSFILAAVGKLMGEDELLDIAAERIEKLWIMFLHLMSFAGGEANALKLFDAAADGPGVDWTGKSIRQYLEDGGDPDIVSRWILSFRFGG